MLLISPLPLSVLRLLNAIFPADAYLKETFTKITSSRPCSLKCWGGRSYHCNLTLPGYSVTFASVFHETSIIYLPQLTSNFRLFFRSLRHKRCEVLEGQYAGAYLVQKARVCSTSVATEKGLSCEFALHMHLREIK